MLKKNVETFLGCDSDYRDARVVLFGAPFDSHDFFPPRRAICERRPCAKESYGLETYSPIRTKTSPTAKFSTAAISNFRSAAPPPRFRTSNGGRNHILKDGKIPFLIGGEHLVTLGAVRAASGAFPDLHIVHFDAHADLRGEYLGAKLSHACVMHRCHELLGDGKIFQFGIRSGDKSEFIWGKERVQTRLFDFEGLERTLDALAGKPVYFTVDLDVLDPSVFPGTGTPEPGGVSFEELRKAVTLVCSRANVVALDVNELSPHYDASGASTAVACKIVREMLLAIQK